MVRPSSGRAPAHPSHDFSPPRAKLLHGAQKETAAKSLALGYFTPRLDGKRRAQFDCSGPSGPRGSARKVSCFGLPISGGSTMRSMKILFLAAVFCSSPLFAQAQSAAPTGAMDQIVAKIASREKQEIAMVREHSPLVETYIQKVRITENDGSWIPDGDHYFIGRADFSKGLDLKPLPAPGDDGLRHLVASITRLFDFGTEFLPQGFLQMIYPDTGGLDTQNYNFDYVRREFLGEVRTLVFDVTPKKKAGNGRFVGRVWVEDQDFTIVRFNGSYSGHNFTSMNFHFDSWRVNAGPNLWLPAFIYSEQKTAIYPI